jgi:hypothetical protein
VSRWPLKTMERSRPDKGEIFSETNSTAIPVSLSANESALEDPRQAAGADRSVAQIHFGRGLCELSDWPCLRWLLVFLPFRARCLHIMEQQTTT